MAAILFGSSVTQPDSEMSKAGIPETMLAARLHGRGIENLRVEVVPVPQPNDNQLLVRVLAAGVCASNLKLISQGADHPFINGWDLARFPIQLGDEGSVTVVAVGNSLRGRFNVGQRYVIQPAVDHPPVFHRDRYRNGAVGMTKIAVGYTLPGHLAEYTLISEEILAADCLLPIPDEDLPAFAAALAEPISCAISAQDRHLHITQKSPNSARIPKLGLLEKGITMIIGAGPMGRLHAEAALRYRPRHLIVVDISEQRLAWVSETLTDCAQRAGVQLHSVLSNSSYELLQKLSDGLGADDIIVAVANAEVQTETQQWLARGGVLNLFAGLKHGEHLIQLDTVRVHYDDIHVIGSSGGSPADIAEALRLIASKEIDAGRHMTMVGSLDQLPKALEMMKNTETDGKIVLYPHIRPTSLVPAKNWKWENEQTFLLERKR
jgi:threonine dehydrogenase-like Zn-dependent dehydrogenase